MGRCCNFKFDSSGERLSLLGLRRGVSNASKIIFRQTAREMLFYVQIFSSCRIQVRPAVKDDPLIVQLRMKRKEKLKVKYPWRGDGSEFDKVLDMSHRSVNPSNILSFCIDPVCRDDCSRVAKTIYGE